MHHTIAMTKIMAGLLWVMATIAAHLMVTMAAIAARLLALVPVTNNICYKLPDFPGLFSYKKFIEKPFYAFVCYIPKILTFSYLGV